MSNSPERRVHEFKFAEGNEFVPENEVTVLVAAFGVEGAVRKAGECLFEERPEMWFDGIEAMHCGSHSLNAAETEYHEWLDTEQDGVLVHPGVPYGDMDTDKQVEPEGCE